MTEKQIRDLAEGYSLRVNKRITTGTDHAHFATFELYQDSAESEQIAPCFNAIREQDANTHRPKLCYVNVDGRPDYGRPYIEIQSIWCETGARTCEGCAEAMPVAGALCRACANERLRYHQELYRNGIHNEDPTGA